MRNETENCAKSCNDTVKDQSLEPFGTVDSVQSAFKQYRNTGNPNAVICRIRLIESVLLQVSYGFDIGHRNCCVRICVYRYRFIICSEAADRKGLFVLDFDLGSFSFRFESLKLSERSIRIKVISLRVDSVKCFNCLHSGGMIIADLLIGLCADAKKMPAITEHAIICPIRCPGSDSGNRYIIHNKHYYREDRKRRPTVSYHFVDLIGDRELSCMLLFIASLDDLSYIYVALVGNNGFGVIIHFVFGSFDVRFDMVQSSFVQIQLLQHLIIAFKYLYRIPPLLLLRHTVHGCFLNMCQRMFNSAGEGMHRNSFTILRCIYRGFRSLHDAHSLQSGDLNHLAAKLP